MSSSELSTKELCNEFSSMLKSVGFHTQYSASQRITSKHVANVRSRHLQMLDPDATKVVQALANQLNESNILTHEEVSLFDEFQKEGHALIQDEYMLESPENDDRVEQEMIAKLSAEIASLKENVHRREKASELSVVQQDILQTELETLRSEQAAVVSSLDNEQKGRSSRVNEKLQDCNTEWNHLLDSLGNVCAAFDDENSTIFGTIDKKQGGDLSSELEKYFAEHDKLLTELNTFYVTHFAEAHEEGDININTRLDLLSRTTELPLTTSTRASGEDMSTALHEQVLQELDRLQQGYPNSETRLVQSEIAHVIAKAQYHALSEELKQNNQYSEEETLDIEQQLHHHAKQLSMLTETKIPAVVNELAHLFVAPLKHGAVSLQADRQEFFLEHQQLIIRYLCHQQASHTLTAGTIFAYTERYKAFARGLETLESAFTSYYDALHKRRVSYTRHALKYPSASKPSRQTIDEEDEDALAFHTLLRTLLCAIDGLDPEVVLKKPETKVISYDSLRAQLRAIRNFTSDVHSIGDKLLLDWDLFTATMERRITALLAAFAPLGKDVLQNETLASIPAELAELIHARESELIKLKENATKLNLAVNSHRHHIAQIPYAMQTSTLFADFLNVSR